MRKSRLRNWLVLSFTCVFIFGGFWVRAIRAQSDEFAVIGWNDLGMHCSNKDFSTIAILPPYNNLMCQVIKKGSETSMPSILSDSFTLLYNIPDNTYSVGKTDFWGYEDVLFGVNLEPNIGLTGNGLSGSFEPIASGNYFEALGIPVTPFTDSDLNHEDPYQLATIKVFDVDMNLMAATQTVIPVSNEINCISSGCHSSEAQILAIHEDLDENEDETEGEDESRRLTAKQTIQVKQNLQPPVLCAKCHASNALNMSGISEAESLSEVIHEKHAEKTNDCYKCHPGPNTQCLRGVMSNQHGMVCRDCHGSIGQVASSIRTGRRPWLDEPDCGSTQCHGAAYSVESGKLYRTSKGHGNLFCSACHGSPHAILPSREARDNEQNVALQGFAGTLKDCTVCHTTTPTGTGPHGMTADGLTPVLVDSQEVQVDVSLNSQTLVDLKCKSEIGARVWVLLQLAEIIPNMWFARPSDEYATQHGRYLFLLSDSGTLTAEANQLFYADPCDTNKIDFGINSFEGLGEVIVKIQKGNSPDTLETIQTLHFY